MNQRIKELAKQVGIMFESTKQNRIHSVNTETLEKFAELIVQECVGLLGPAHSVMTDPIKEHFGLER